MRDLTGNRINSKSPTPTFICSENDSIFFQKTKKKKKITAFFREHQRAVQDINIVTKTEKKRLLLNYIFWGNRSRSPFQSTRIQLAFGVMIQLVISRRN